MRPTFALALVATLWAAAAPADPAPAVTIANGKPGAFTVHAPAATKLRTLAAIEGRRDGAWIDVSAGFDSGDGYRLIARCDARPGACVTLAAGATLAPVPWSGMSCSSQCNHTCDKNAPLAAGEYRLVLTSCDGKRTFVGPVFQMDGKDR
jgi:hypothetical protein